MNPLLTPEENRSRLDAATRELATDETRLVGPMSADAGRGREVLWIFEEVLPPAQLAQERPRRAALKVGNVVDCITRKNCSGFNLSDRQKTTFAP